MRFGGQQLSEILSWEPWMLDRVYDELLAFEKEFRGVTDEIEGE